MTIIKIHGFLSKEFGSEIKINLGKINNIITAIDSIKNGFRKRIIELQSIGYNFSIQKENKIIYFLPLIGGSGKTFARIFSIVLIVVGVVLMFVPGMQLLGMQIMMSGMQLASAAFSNFKINFPKIEGSTGGATYVSESVGKSFIFSNLNNLASQGKNIQLGYGLMKIGSQLISVSIKNYSINQSFQKENYFTSSEPSSASFSVEYDPNINSI